MRPLALASLALTLAACSANPCDRNAQVDLAKKAGDCAVPKTPLLGEPGACATALKACSGDDQAALVKALDCLDKLAVCTGADQTGWEASRRACVTPLEALPKGCLDALGGTDGLGQTTPDAGLWAVNDGGHGVDFVAVADESSVALAWSPLQPGAVQTWVVASVDEAGVRTDAPVGGPGVVSLYLPDAGPARRFFVVGLDPQGALVWGVVDAGRPPELVDAGPPPVNECHGPLDCDIDHVCDLTVCVNQTCASGSTTCPAGYLCLSDHCIRTFSDGGVFDAGAPSVVDAGPPPRPLPFLSPEIALAAGPAVASAAVPLGGFAGRHADVAALDSARVVAILEQEGQLVAHRSSRRGRDFADDVATTVLVDTIGTRPRLAWNLESRALFACYTVGRAVRVRVSVDEGRTWGETGATIEPGASPDGGASTSTAVSDCDLAPWKNGGVLMVTVDDDTLAVRTVGRDLQVGAPEIAMRSSPPSAGNVYQPAHPAIATLPADGLIHVTFTGTRQLPSLVADSEIFGVTRDASSSSFGAPVFLKPGFGAIAPGTSLPQDWSTVVIDPKSKRAIAAYVSQEGGSSGNIANSVYVALYYPALKAWGTGPDLSVFAIDSRDNVTTLLFPQKQKADVWDAFSPTFSALPNGRLFLTFVAGPRPGSYGDYRLYTVGFDYDAVSPASNGAGWFVRPVRSLGPTRVLSPSGVTSSPPAPIAAAACDAHLSLVTVFAEGLGGNGEVESRMLFSTLP